jgi:8-oxo-dGTP pyrophosphatase MutT (NUDIX family)
MGEEQMMEYSAGCVVFKTFKAPFKVLIIQQKHGLHFGFPKGHLEAFETAEDAALRETKEEVGLDVDLTHHHIKMMYQPKPDVLKTVTYYLAKAKNFDIDIQEQEIISASFMEVSKALQVLTYQNDKDVLNTFIKILSEGAS